MSVPSVLARSSVPAPAATTSRTLKQRYRRRQQLVYTLRIALAVLLVGGWEIGARTKVIDPFYYGQPTGIYAQLHTWVVDGTAQGPLWKQVAVTLEETVMGFAAEVIGGVVFGIVLGTNRLLADIFSPYIKGLQLHSQGRPGLDLHDRLRAGADLQGPAGVRARVLRGVLQRLPGRPRGRPEPRQQRADSGGEPVAHRPRGHDPVRAVLDPRQPAYQLRLRPRRRGRGEFLGSTQGVGSLIQIATQAFNANGVFAAMTLLAFVALTAEALVTKLENRLITWRPTPVSDITL